MAKAVDVFYARVLLSCVLYFTMASCMMLLLPENLEYTRKRSDTSLSPVDAYFKEKLFPFLWNTTRDTTRLVTSLPGHISNTIPVFELDISIILDLCDLFPKELIIVTFNWLYHNSVQILLYAAIIYLVYRIQKEDDIRKGLIRDYRIAKNTLGHIGWQVDVHVPEMEALTARLNKNEIERIPDILNQLQTLSIMRDINQQRLYGLEDELLSWRLTIQSETRKLRNLNMALYSEAHSKTLDKIRNVALEARKRMDAAVDGLHKNIEDARSTLDETSKLLDVKGIPMRVDYSLEYGLDM